jgi:hypothetical protein
MKRIDQALNKKILEARFRIDRARRQMGQLDQLNWLRLCRMGFSAG